MSRILKKITGLATLVLLLNGALAQGDGVNGSDLTWGPAPDVFPPGAELSVLEGVPGQAMPITLRLKFPAAYEIPAHWHSSEEDVTVLSGSLNVGTGDVLDRAAGSRLTAGGFVELAANTNYYVWTDEATVIQISLNGPFDMTYADPSQDPRTAATTSAADRKLLP